MVEKLTNPPPAVPREVVFRPASPLPDIGFPDEIPGLTVDQATVDQYVDWQSYDKTWLMIRLGLMVGMTPTMSWTSMGLGSPIRRTSGS